MATLNLNTTFRQRLKEAIRHDGRPIKSIAFRSGYAYSHIRRVLDGTRPNPTLAFVDCIAGTLGVDPLYLLGGTIGDQTEPSTSRDEDLHHP